MNLEQAIQERMSQFVGIYETGMTELTGKAILEHGTHGHVVGRYGGLKPSFPELASMREGPKQIAAAIRKGSGPVYEDIEWRIRRAMSKAGYRPARKRKRGPLVVSPHEGRSRCKHCREMHAKGEHRFHGPGSFHQTHLFSFGSNPMRRRNPATLTLKAARELFSSLMRLSQTRELTLQERKYLQMASQRIRYAKRSGKNPRRIRKIRRVLRRHRRRVVRRARRQNPPTGTTKIYGKVLAVHIRNGRVHRIEAQKTQAHRCDAECRAVGHRYYHDFKNPPVMGIYGSADHAKLIMQ